MRENTFLFSLLSFVVEILLRESARLETRKNHGFATLNLGHFYAVIVADIFNKNKPSFYQHLGLFTWR